MRSTTQRVFAQAGTVRDATPGDEGLDAALPQQAAVLVVVVAAVGEQPLGFMDPRTAWEEAAFFAGHPGQGLSYLAKEQILDLLTDCARREGGTFDFSAFLGRLWREGNVPFALQRWELLGDRGHVDAARRRADDL